MAAAVAAENAKRAALKDSAALKAATAADVSKAIIDALKATAARAQAVAVAAAAKAKAAVAAAAKAARMGSTRATETAPAVSTTGRAGKSSASCPASW